MVSGRCAAVIRQSIVIGFLFFIVTIFILGEEKMVLEEVCYIRSQVQAQACCLLSIMPDKHLKQPVHVTLY